MKYEIIFCVVAILLMAGVIGLFAWRLLSGKSNKEGEWTRTAENIASLRDEYDHLVELRKAGRIADKDFFEREDELALRVIDETAPETAEKHRNVEHFPLVTAAALAVIIPATSIGAYLWYGDFSSLDEKAIEQIRTTREQARSERNMTETVASLEASVEKNRDNLEAWEILAEQYNATGNLSQAELAYENVTRLSPKNANAWAELADIKIALDPSSLVKAGALAQKALEIDPWHQKALMIGAAAAFEAGDYKNSAIYFNRLLTQIPEGNEVHDALAQQLQMTLDAGGLKSVPPDPAGKKPESDLDKMLKMGGGMSAAPEMGEDGVGLNPLKR
ncbi:c-type cytochrome biogenesis protein CcmI [Sutterella faecalis]|uniref:C-type cytochrome biogenesis protein CcmI n=2 Tax=Sutterella TaxID=40544 RepID=A0AAI9SCZ6_9BURK|nr:MULTISPECIES: c-type cytochrome biogenesis protein CcmI [Sutterella]KAB7651052.1 c-type cytochrome biogenesis protein CcmI [Sutterella seckii]MBE5692590.1 c-type cytochrome biogenesis protein CcmI [Sutterella sp.]QDA53936.1 c-type cytochrome biogenesis protein CcmI [Sutterella faecalis]